VPTLGTYACLLRSQRGVLAPTLGDADGARRARKPVTANLDNSDNLERKVPSKDHPGPRGRGDPHLTYCPEGHFLWLSRLPQPPLERETLELAPLENTPYRGLMI
jgi:hypothetical protein